MQKKNIEVLRKILYAVESGGQVYGCQNYAAFIGAGANCSNEKAITIGAGQWYAGEAKSSCRRFRERIQRSSKSWIIRELRVIYSRRTGPHTRLPRLLQKQNVSLRSSTQLLEENARMN